MIFFFKRLIKKLKIEKNSLNFMRNAFNLTLIKLNHYKIKNSFN